MNELDSRHQQIVYQVSQINPPYMAKKYTKKQPWGTISKHIQLFEMFRELYKIGELIQKQMIDIYICSYMFVYMYVAVYIYIYTHTHIYIYIYE